MLQGLNCRCSIYRDLVFADDDIGGPIPTSALKYSKVKCRVSSVRPTQMAREAGLETPRLYNVVLQPAGLDIRENDNFYLTFPNTHELYHKLIPIDGVQIDSIAPSDTIRRHMELTLSRVVRSRTE
jgi:hypothetical protein